MKLTIITVTYLDPEGLERTLSSLRRINASVDFRQIIVDGNPDQSAKIVANLAKLPWELQVVPDFPSGIYQAMNVGLDYAKAGPVWFLNGGDEAGEPSAILAAMNKLISSEADVVCAGVTVRRGKKDRFQKPPASFWGGLRGYNGFCHQAVIARSESIHLQGKFDTSMKYAADYDLLFKLWKSGARYSAGGGVIATFYRGGISDNKFSEVMKEFGAIQAKALGGESNYKRFSNFLFFYMERVRLWIVEFVRTFQNLR